MACGSAQAKTGSSIRASLMDRCSVHLLLQNRGEVVQRDIVSKKDNDDKIHTSSNTSPTYVYADVVPLDE